jgi:hypothetical protein
MRPRRLAPLVGVAAVVIIVAGIELRAGRTDQPAPPSAAVTTASTIQAGGRLVGGVVLVAAQPMDIGASHGGTLAGQCRWAAHELGFAVPCPGLLPRDSAADVGTVGSNCPGLTMNLGPGCGEERGYSFASIEFPADERVGHLVIIGSPRRMSAREIISSPLPPPAQVPVVVEGSVVIHGRPAQVVRVPPSSATAFGEHLVLVWTVGDHTYALGVHGTDPGARALDLALAASVHLVQP